MVKRLPKKANADGTKDFGGRFPLEFHEVATHAARSIEGISLNSYIIRAVKRDPAYKRAKKDLAADGKKVYGTNQDQTNNEHEGSPE